MTLAVLPCLKQTLIALMLLCCIAFSEASLAAEKAASQQTTELAPISEQIAFLVLGIIRYSRWPEAPEQVDVCILGDVQYADILMEATHYIGEVPVVSQVVTLEQALTDHKSCHVYYLGQTSSQVYQQLYQAVGTSAVITMEEENEYCSIGGMFCFNVENSKASFKINLDAISRSKVRIHPSVLRLGQYRSDL
ncbi:YfiR family protein [Alkalimonas sp. MEB108]|uniref:YfiR family protein n=1 Tax=Alkalimonas cellulosilytica TaxID=3058395 RepID=A0ABU7J8R9_9GAMM|nr:YfiR family protein [Alkalimonas sp. MEB108]MEE2002407.1 YfiR family protein [Alkalimonas sp. MEB108]